MSVSNINTNSYNKNINKYSYEELVEEKIKLYNLLSSLNQEYIDRKETIYLIINYIDIVNNKILELSNYTKDSSDEIPF